MSADGLACLRGLSALEKLLIGARWSIGVPEFISGLGALLPELRALRELVVTLDNSHNGVVLSEEHAKPWRLPASLETFEFNAACMPPVVVSGKGGGLRQLLCMAEGERFRAMLGASPALSRLQHYGRGFPQPDELAALLRCSQLTFLDTGYKLPATFLGRTAQQLRQLTWCVTRSNGFGCVRFLTLRVLPGLQAVGASFAGHATRSSGCAARGLPRLAVRFHQPR